MVKKTFSSKARRSPKTAVVPSKHKGHGSLLIELRTEELPPKSLERLSLVFASGVYDSLKEQGFLVAGSVQQVFATPRRLAVLISQVLPKQPDRMVERKGPAVASAIGADGKPAPALLGFAKSCGVDVGKLEKRAGDKGEYFVHSFKQKGGGLAPHLATIVEASLKKLPVAKLMRWGDSEVQFVRPVHGLIMLHAKKVVPGVVLGLKSGNKTLGHRFLSQGAITITAATDYEKILEKKGSVIADYQRRKDMITQRLDAEAKKIGAATHWALGNHAKLLDEVTSIVEYPVIYAGEFSKDFLSLPSECLVISMQQHQKYFPLATCRSTSLLRGGKHRTAAEARDGRERPDKTGKLLARFLFVSNNRSTQPKQVIHGNERVLRARLSDAGFFYAQDRKIKLADRVPKLANVVYHNKLGSQLDRVERLQKLAGEIARRLHAQVTTAERAAYLCKADLVTDMVGEFPELQGTMGYHYALNDGEADNVARAIKEHYLPRHAGDILPTSAEDISVALADKLDTLVGIYGVGLVPTGDKDPFGLRRQALGVIRILLESKHIPSVDLMELLQLARGHYPSGGLVSDRVAQDLYGFMLERLKPYLREKGFLPDEIDAVLSLNLTRMDQLILRLEALQMFRVMPEAQALAAANKRIHNILKQAGGAEVMAYAIDADCLIEDAEKALAECMVRVAAKAAPLFTAGNYTEALKQLAQLRDPVDAFFEKVMVMAEDEKLRHSRLALLYQIRQLFLQVADISKLQS